MAQSTHAKEAGLKCMVVGSQQSGSGFVDSTSKEVVTKLMMNTVSARNPGRPLAPVIVHPLDPLSAAEVEASVLAVRASVADPSTHSSLRFCEVSLLEPKKEVVAVANAHFFQPYQNGPYLSNHSPHSWNVLPPRQARLVVYNKLTNETTVYTIEFVYETSGRLIGEVLSGEVVPDVQPPMDAMEYKECEATVKAFPPFQEAMKKRGITDMKLVMVDPWCVGYFSERDNPNRRLAKPLIFVRSESTCSVDNGYARPVEGLYVLVDMQRMEILEFEDREMVPLPPTDPLRNYTAGPDRGAVDRTDVKPLVISQPEGPSFRVDGYYVEWQKWSFRVGFTPKEGLVLHSLAYADDSRGTRHVAHRLSFCEMVVPYGDPREPHYRKNAFDAGEDGLGKNAHSLKKGCDCLGSIHYFDAFLTSFLGTLEVIPNAVCLHEEDHGMLWKHVDWRSGHAEVRRGRRLTASFVCTVANYEYGFFWHLYQDGKVEGEVKLTGILSVGVAREGEVRKFGSIVAPGLYAPIHQHFFVARLDMGVDAGPGEGANQVVEVNVRTEEAGPDNPHNNAFFAEETVLKSEAEAVRDCSPTEARYWLIRNTRKVNRNGHPTAYKLVPGQFCLPFARPQAAFLRRAPFLLHNLWVTQHCPGENFPGGEFPNQNPRVGEGLATWVKQDRRIDDNDVVLWYVFGVTHVARPEDWPVMPVERTGFLLQPEGFFNISPAADVPPSKPDESESTEKSCCPGAKCAMSKL